MALNIDGYPTPAATPPNGYNTTTTQQPAITVLASSRAVIRGKLTSATIVISLNTGKVISTFSSVLPASNFPSGTPYCDHSPYILLPGLVDAHVHLNEPGRTEWEGFWTGTMAAAYGGVTTVVDMPLNAIPPTTTVNGLREKVKAAEGQCWVDVGFYGGIVPGNVGELKSLVKEGVRGFKGFLIDSGVDEFPAVSSTDVAKVMVELADDPTILMFHAEMIPPITASVGDNVQWSLPPLVPVGPLNEYATFLASRPVSFETYAISQILSLAPIAPHLPLHIVHLSAIEAIPLIREARAHGIKITAETCFHYLSLTAETIKDGDTRHKCCPPIRTKSNQDGLWEELLQERESVIATVVSDHSPCTPDLKLLPSTITGKDTQATVKDEGDFFSAWGGVSSVGLGLSILWTEGQQRGITAENIVEWCCKNTAKQIGLEFQKGDLSVGFDGDVAVFDDEAIFDVAPDTMLFRNKHSPYQGKTLKGVCELASSAKRFFTTTTRRSTLILVVVGTPHADAPSAMVKLGTSRRKADKMGVTSSQLGPSTAIDLMEEQGTTMDQPKLKQYGKKKGKRKSAEMIENINDEQESARALLELRENGGRNVRPPSYEDGLAASAQLLAESSPPRPSRSHTLKASSQIESDTQEKFGRNSRSKEMKRKRRGTKAKNEEVLANRNHQSPHTPTKLSGPHNHDLTSSQLPPSTFSLDDIGSNDEDVSAFLQEYEHDLVGSGSPSASPMNNSNAQGFKLVVPDSLVHVVADDAMYPMYGPLSPAYIKQSNGKQGRKRKMHADRAPSSDSDEHEGFPDGSSRQAINFYDVAVHNEKHKNKRKKGSDRSTPNGHGEHQELLNGTGQHAFDHDFDVFDQYMINNGMDLANPFHDCPGQTMPIDPELLKDSSSNKWADGGVQMDLDDTTSLQPSNKGKLSRKQRNLAISSLLQDSDSSYVSPYSKDEEQSDRVLPGIEDPTTSGNYGDSHPDHLAKTRSENSPLSREKDSRISNQKARRQSRTKKVSDPSIEEIAEKGGGKFTSEEFSKLTAFRDAYCEENEISNEQFNTLVHTTIRSNPVVIRLFDDIHSLVPYRKRASTIKFCRRRFHNFSARGTWTKEEDEMLKQAVEEKGSSWKAVGEIVDRMPEDCRDRWRNYLVNSENRNSEKWTVAEIGNLVMAVHDCMKIMKRERRVAKEEKYAGMDMPESESEANEEAKEIKLINWQVVSGRMGENGVGLRSRLQCSQKYATLKMADRNEHIKRIRDVRKGLERLDKGGGPVRKGRDWRMRRATKKMQYMKSGDKYELLQALSTCRAIEEGNIPWKTLGEDSFRARWSRIERRAAWGLLKQEVRGADQMNYHDVVNRLLTKLMAEDMEGLDEHYEPDLEMERSAGGKKLAAERSHKKGKSKRAREANPTGTQENGSGVLNAPMNGIEKKKRGRSTRSLEKQTHFKSSRLVHSSDEEEEEHPQTGSPEGKRPNTPPLFLTQELEQTQHPSPSPDLSDPSTQVEDESSDREHEGDHDPLSLVVDVRRAGYLGEDSEEDLERPLQERRRAEEGEEEGEEEDGEEEEEEEDEEEAEEEQMGIGDREISEELVDRVQMLRNYQ